MRIVVFGANGGSGRALVDQALAAGEEVTAVTRHPESFPLRHERLSTVAGDATDREFVDGVVRGADAVVSALGVPYTRQQVSLHSMSAAHIIDAMRQAGVRRLVVVSSSAVDPGAGSQRSFVFDHLVEPFLARVAGRTLYQDMRRMEALVTRSGLDWTIVRPAGLFDAASVGRYQAGEGFVRGRFTSRQDLAAFLLAQASDTRYVGKVAGVVTPGANPNVLGIIWRDGIHKK